MDAYIYALVLVPALTEILPNSGIEPTPVNVGFYGMVLLAMCLLGWGLRHQPCGASRFARQHLLASPARGH